MPNSHIEEYLRFHLSLPESTGFSVMLTGGKGSGKTWFIKKFFKEYTDRRVKVLYASLYGVTSLTEIDDQIYHQLKVDFDTHRSDRRRLRSTITDILANDRAGTYILVFDDMERSTLATKSLLGYIHAFVEQEGLRSIIIANSDELDRELYTELNEKLVGKSLQVENDISSAFDSFIKKMSTDSARWIINTRKELILALFHKAGYGDLRHLYQTLLDLEFFLKDFPNKFLVIKEIMKEIIELFCIFSFELKSGTIQAADLRQIGYLSMDQAYMDANEYGQDAMNNPMLKVTEKYSILYDVVLSPVLWSDHFSKGHIDRDRLTESLDSCKYFLDDASPAWQRLWHYKELEEDEYEVLLSIVKEQWEKYEFDSFGEILHVSGMFLFFSSLGIYKKSDSAIIEESKTYIDKKREEALWHHGQRDLLEFDMGNSWEQLDFLGAKSSGFQEIRHYFKEQFESYLAESLAQDTQALIALMIEDPEDLSSESLSQSPQRQRLYDRPLFYAVEVESFFEIFLDLRNKTKQQVIAIFVHRYEQPYLAEALVDELPFLISFAERLTEESDRQEGRLSGHLLADIRLTIDKAITSINEAELSLKEREVDQKHS